MAVDNCPIQAIEEEWRQALLAKDEPVLRRILHPRFQLVGVRPTGFMAVDVDGWIDALRHMDIATIDIEVMDCVALGHVMVATVKACWKVRYLGQEIEEKVLLTDVWVEGPEGWQIVRRHSSTIPAGAAA